MQYYILSWELNFLVFKIWIRLKLTLLMLTDKHSLLSFIADKQNFKFMGAWWLWNSFIYWVHFNTLLHSICIRFHIKLLIFSLIVFGWKATNLGKKRAKCVKEDSTRCVIVRYWNNDFFFCDNKGIGWFKSSNGCVLHLNNFPKGPRASKSESQEGSYEPDK